jgi:hypothetical protein
VHVGKKSLPLPSGLWPQREALRQFDALRQQLESLGQLELSGDRTELLQAQTRFLEDQLATLQRIEDLNLQAEAILREAIETLTGTETSSVRSSLMNRVDRWLRTSLDRMSDEEVLRAVEALSPAETIAEILVSTPAARVGTENDWAELLLRGADAKQNIAGLAGGLLSSSEAAAILRISVPGVKQRLERKKLLAVPLAGGQWGFPALQFAENGLVRAGVPEIAQAGAEHDAWTVLSILVDDVPDGSGVLLERLDDPVVLRDAVQRLESYGEHVAA